MLYIHIPFCKKACHYCDFHFSTNFSTKKLMVDAICKEIALQKNYLPTNILSSVYFGGGTPSVLAYEDLSQIFAEINKYFLIEKNAEITLEANPDDIFEDNLQHWQNVGINRLSVGVQSFYDPFLQWTNRNHNALEAENAIKKAQDMGFDAISLDLIYGFPAQNHDIWHSDLQKALSLNVPHISAYCLTIEEKTVFGKWLKQKKIKQVEEDFAGQQFEILIDTLTQNNYIHYEISNFCKPQRLQNNAQNPKNYAQHNTNYWLGKPYLGIGASAHSYNMHTRQYNMANNTRYIKEILENNHIPAEIEILTQKDKYNEYVLTRLRTHWGIDVEKIKNDFGDFWGENQHHLLNNYIKNNFLTQKDNFIFLTQKGKLIADTITEDFFVI